MSRTSPALIATVLLFGAVGSPVHGADSRAAVVLYNPQPLYPPEAAGSDVSPEASLRVEVDANGRVARVEVVRLDPSTPLDDAFRRILEETIAQWRFAPRHQDGEAVSTELQWTTKFYAPTVGNEVLIGGDRWDAILGIQPTHQRSFLELPYDQRVKLLEARVRAGLAAFATTQPIQHSSDWFVVRTDASLEVATVIANNLQAVYGILYSLFAEHLPMQGERLKVQVFVFQDPAGLAQLQSVCFPHETSPPGFYSQLGLIAMHLQLPSPDVALSLLIHEGTHAFMDRHVVRPGVRLPYWLTEGLAEYMANSTIRKGELIPGKVPRARRANVRMIQGRVHVARWEPMSALTLAQIKRAARLGEALSLEQMLEADAGDFMGEQLGLYYGMSWLLVHYLQHGRESWATHEFPAFLLYVGEGYPIAEAFETIYATRIAESEQSFRDYLVKF